ncbi:hypothetical protein B0H10DRAFT_1948697 [Mycena sp. CBHHK59/15]|nr:hypothetical protein B0H10DRAFT_1948697 [Mycena sp. CBHHK59/15]
MFQLVHTPVRWEEGQTSGDVCHPGKIIPKESTSSTSRPYGQDGGARPYVSKPAQGSNLRALSANIKCYQRGGPHYKLECPQLKGKALFAVCNIINDVSEPEGDPPDELENEGMEDGERLPPLMFCSDNISDTDSEVDSDNKDERSAYESEHAECGWFVICDDWSEDSEIDPEEDDKQSSYEPEPAPHTLRSCFAICDDWSEDEWIVDRDVDQLAQEMANLFIDSRGSTKTVIEHFGALAEESVSSTNRYSVYLRHSKIACLRPKRKKSENFCLTGYVHINGKAAFALFDSRCTTEACSPDFARVAGIKVILEYDNIRSEEYLDIVNLDRFDVVIGTKFMRRHKISLDFEFNTVWVCSVPAPMLSESEAVSEVKHRKAPAA